MNVKKIFITLVTVVACVILGALALNIIMPNVVTTVISATEDMVFKGTGLSFDFNGDGNKGDNNKTYKGGENGGTITKPSTGF